MSKNTEDGIAIRLGRALLAAGKSLATAESCTGGLVAKMVTDVAGSSGWFDRAFITYTNEAKHEMLGVPIDVISENGAVSEPVVREMAAGALASSHAQISVAISGVAGPGGGSEEKPVGTVWFAWAFGDDECLAERVHFAGDRESIREQAALHAMRRIINRLAS